jgi:predicted metal-dependent enzyme (double-stranded beta helix superfamily)
MFDLDAFLADCQAAADDGDPRGAIREVLVRTLEARDDVSAALAKNEGGLNVLHSAPDLTVLNVIWAPHMTLYPHDHRMWAAIGIYGGAEENLLYRRGAERIQPAGERMLDTGDVLGLGRDAIHAVHNPRDTFTGAIHVYGGDFVHEPRSQWDPDTLLEGTWDMAEVQRLFAAANEEWRAQLGHDLDEDVTKVH